MAESRLSTDEYIASVEARAGEADSLAALEVASAVRRELEDIADEVMEHFVGAARRTGHSWTAIGDRLGISKQAARQRYGELSPTLVGHDLVVMIRLQACLDHAQAAAEHNGDAETDTHHLLLGLLQVGVAAAVLDKLGVTREGVQQSITRLVGAAETNPRGGPPDWSADAQQAIDSAKAFARQHEFDYVGTEHLLYVLATDPGSQASRVLQDLGVDPAAAVRELERKVTLRPTQSRRRRRRHGNEPRCAFCRKAKPGVRKVAGPGVCICEDCLRLASNALS